MSLPTQTDRHGTSAGFERGQPEKKKRKPRYSGEAETTDLDRMERSCADINIIISTLKGDEGGVLEDLSELTILEIQVKNLKENISDLKKLRALPDNHGKKVQKIPFSKLTRSNLENRLGVRTDTIKVDSLDGFLEEITIRLRGEKGDAHVTSILDAIKEHNNIPAIVRMLSLIKRAVHSAPEMTARMQVDQWLFETVHLCLALRPAVYTTFILPELKIASLGHGLEVRIELGDFVSYITGSTDYLIWTHPFDMPGDADFSTMMSNTENISTSIKLFSSKTITSIYEAKRKREDLGDHLPQVVGECLALCLKLTSSNDTQVRKEISFCLSSGDQWLFGVFDSESKTCTRTSVLNIDVNEESMVEQILTLVMFWTIYRADILQRAMEGI